MIGSHTVDIGSKTVHLVETNSWNIEQYHYLLRNISSYGRSGYIDVLTLAVL